MNVIPRIGVTGFRNFVFRKHLRNKYLNMLNYSTDYKAIILTYTVRCSFISHIKIMKYFF